MYKRAFRFVDYDGNDREEEHYFNLNKAELIKFLSTNNEYTLDKVMGKLVKERNAKQVMEIVDELIHISYGRKSLDGRKFEKSEEIWNDFRQTEAYSELFSELVTDAEKTAKFFNAIIPKDLAAEVDKFVREHPEKLSEISSDYVIDVK